MTAKKFRKTTSKSKIPPKQKMEHTYCASCKKYTGNTSSKTITNKVKFLKKYLKCKHDKSMFLKQIYR